MQLQEPLTAGTSVFALSRPESTSRRTYSTEYVRSLFNRIAPRYDFLNHLLSFGIDFLWRKRAIGVLRPAHPRTILDVATGTGDLAFEAARILSPNRVVGIDVAEEMLEIARTKAKAGGWVSTVFETGTAEHLPFPDNQFDAVTVAFGVRNFSDLDRGLREMLRVLRPGGSLVVLEFSRPRAFPVRLLYDWYSRHLLPSLGGLISRSREAYEYLPGTIRMFPDGPDFLAILRRTGFQSVIHFPLTFGIATIYHGIKGTVPGQDESAPEH